jgi:hypothetical protein
VPVTEGGLRTAKGTKTLNPIAVVPAKAGTQCLIFGGTGNDRFGCRVFGRRAIRGHAIDLIDRDGVDSALEGG